MLSVSRFTQFKIYDCALKINIMVKVGLECESSVDIIGKWTKIMRTIAIDAVEVAIGATFFLLAFHGFGLYFHGKLPKFKLKLHALTELLSLNG